MSVSVEAQTLLRELAAPAVPGELVCAAISRAARRAGLNASRGSKLWYGNAKAILASEMDQLRARAAEARERQRNDLGQRGGILEHRLEQIERRLDALASQRARGMVDEQG